MLKHFNLTVTIVQYISGMIIIIDPLLRYKSFSEDVQKERADYHVAWCCQPLLGHPLFFSTQRKRINRICNRLEGSKSMGVATGVEN